MTARNASQRIGIEDAPPAPHWGYAPQGAPQGAPPDTRYINGRRVKAAGMVDDHGMYYILPKSRAASLASSLITAIAIGVLIACALLFLPSFLAPPTTTTNVYQLGTADVPPRPTQEPPAPASAPLFPDATPVPTYDNRAYNATAQARQAEPTVERPAPQPAPAVAPAHAPTPLPEPGTAEFEPSFQEPVCASSAFITYLPGHPCHGRNGERPLVQPGEDGFVESFE